MGGVVVGGVYGGDSDGKETVRKEANMTGMGRWQWEGDVESTEKVTSMIGESKQREEEGVS